MGAFRLTWDAATDNVGVTGYRIYRDTVLDQTVGAVLTVDLPNPGAGTYDYTVRAIDAAGNEGPDSNTFQITTAGDGFDPLTLFTANAADDVLHAYGESVGVMSAFSGELSQITANPLGSPAVADLGGGLGNALQTTGLTALVSLNTNISYLGGVGTPGMSFVYRGRPTQDITGGNFALFGTFTDEALAADDRQITLFHNSGGNLIFSVNFGGGATFIQTASPWTGNDPNLYGLHTIVGTLDEATNTGNIYIDNNTVAGTNTYSGTVADFSSNVDNVLVGARGQGGGGANPDDLPTNSDWKVLGFSRQVWTPQNIADATTFYNVR